MNPFTQSTVARPLPEHHPDHKWASSVGTECKPPHGEPRAADDSRQMASDDQPCVGKLTDSHKVDEACSRQSARYARCKRQSARLRRRGLSRHATLQARRPLGSVTLALCLSCASVLSGMVTKPATLAGSFAAAAALMPRAGAAVNLNTASALQLQEVKGIGPKTAAMIVEERERGGNFQSLTDLSDRVRGIGPKKAAALEAAGLKVIVASSQAGAGAAGGPARAGRSTRR